MADKQQQKKKQDVNPYSGKFVPKKKDPLRPFLPVLGLLIIGAAGAVAWFSAPFIKQWLFQQNYIALPASVMTADQFMLEILISFMVFSIIVAFAGLLYAIVAPRPPKLVSENILAAERKQIELDRQREEARKRKMKSKMKKVTKGMDEL